MKFPLRLLAVIFPLVTGIAHASNEAAENRLKASVDQVVTIARDSKTREALISAVKPVLENILNFEVLTRRSIGPGWKQFSPDQQKEAVKLYTILTLRTYTAKFTAGELPAVEYQSSSSTAPGRVEITTTSLYKGSHYDVVYRMEDQNGNWTITDVVIEGISLVANYRTQFDSEFKKGGPEAVLKALRHAVDESK